MGTKNSFLGGEGGGKKEERLSRPEYFDQNVDRLFPHKKTHTKRREKRENMSAKR